MPSELEDAVDTLEPTQPDPDEPTPCLVRWMVETEAGWLGAWDREAFDAYAASCIAKNDGTNSWQPIETAPKDETLVDLWRAGGERCANMRRVVWQFDDVFYGPNYRGHNCVRDATHWILAPEPPK